MWKQEWRISASVLLAAQRERDEARALIGYVVDRHDAAAESALHDPLAGELVEVLISADWRAAAAAWYRSLLGDPAADLERLAAAGTSTDEPNP